MPLCCNAAGRRSRSSSCDRARQRRRRADAPAPAPRAPARAAPPARCQSARADDALLAAQLAVPRMRDRRRDDPRLLRAQDVLRAVVDQHVDVDLARSARPCPTSSAARRTAGRSAPATRAVASCASVERWLVMWMKWPASCQARDRLDRARVRRGAEHVLGAVALGHQRGDLLAAQLDDVPRDLLVVGERRRRSAAAQAARTGPSSGAMSSRCRSRCASCATG